MIECKTYPISELGEILHTRDTQGIKRKLQNYGISYTQEGSGSDLKLTITNIENPFKVFCIVELGFAANCDFCKLRNFVLYFFCDDEFRLLPDEAMQERLTADGNAISRQTIRRWLNRLEEKGLLSQTMGERYYYCVRGNKRWEITAEQYRKGWAAYWEHINEGYSSRSAFSAMVDVNNGIVKKKIVPLLNACCNKTIDTLVDLAQEEIEKEIRSGEPK